MTNTQEPKYTIQDGQLVNRSSGEAIPSDEPVMIFRARDRHAEAMIHYYAELVTDEEHKIIVKERADDFARFRRKNPERMKEPDTARAELDVA